VSTVVGSIGTGLLLLAYALHASGRIPLGRAYFAMNAIGAVTAAAASVMLRFAPFVILEIVWFGVAAAGFVRTSQKDADAAQT
jgi:hypothetical protein